MNRNPEHHFAEIEQSAFSPPNIVPGIGFSPDRMLQARGAQFGSFLLNKLFGVRSKPG